MSEMAFEFGHPSKTLTKIERYKWKVQDSPGNQEYINKNKLRVNHKYQRDEIYEQKIREIASNWSWLGCGTITVAMRNGEYWVVDGQHRVLAAKRRADISMLPCIVFKTESVEQEAIGFLNANTGRKAISSIDKFRAKIASGDETANYINSFFNELGIIIAQRARSGMQIKSMGWAMKRAEENRDAFDAVIRMAAELCQETMLHETLLEGLYYIHMKSSTKLDSKRLRDRLKKIGAIRLVDAAKRASSFFATGGAKVWAEGMLSEINKGLREKIVIDA